MKTQCLSLIEYILFSSMSAATNIETQSSALVDLHFVFLIVTRNVTWVCTELCADSLNWTAT